MAPEEQSRVLAETDDLGAELQRFAPGIREYFEIARRYKCQNPDRMRSDAKARPRP